MGRNRFVKPRVDRLPLSDGEWIDVKHELNAGERRRIFSHMVKEHRAGERALIDTEKIGFSKVSEYVVGWSLCDDKGPVDFSEAALSNLDSDTYQEISDAIDAHETKVDAEIADRKNVPATASSSSAT